MDSKSGDEPATAENGVEATSRADGESLVELILSDAPPPSPARIDGVVVGRLAAISDRGEPLVDYEASPSAEPLIARSISPYTPADVGREVALMFEGADPTRPILMGLMFVSPAPPKVEEAAVVVAAPPAVERDGERLVFTAEREIVLRCGQASITLTRAGKILIRGAYLLARSSGVNRIQGGSVQIN